MVIKIYVSLFLSKEDRNFCSERERERETGRGREAEDLKDFDTARLPLISILITLCQAHIQGRIHFFFDETFSLGLHQRPLGPLEPLWDSKTQDWKLTTETENYCGLLHSTGWCSVADLRVWPPLWVYIIS